LLLTSGGYYIFTVYRAFNKYYNRPIATVLSHKHVNEMDFPAVAICSLNLFAKSKLLMKDDNPLFESSGLNISSCAVTAAGVRGDRPCELSFLCCLLHLSLKRQPLLLPNCTTQYKQDLLSVMHRKSHRPDVDTFIWYYSQDIDALLGSMCEFVFGVCFCSECSAKHFVPAVTEWGKCYTFNSGTDGEVKTVESGGVSNGLSVILSYGKFSEGSKDAGADSWPRRIH